MTMLSLVGHYAEDYPAVQQSDIDGVANFLKPKATNEAQTSLQAQLHSDEKLVSSPQCTSTTTHDKNAGDIAQSFNVKVTVTCNAEAYEPEVAQKQAEVLLERQASTDLDPSYVLSGNTVTTITQVSVTDTKKGTLALTIIADGIWAFHFSDSQKQTLAKLIEGKSQQDAQDLLSHQTGVSGAQVTVSGGFWIWNTVPTNLANIKIMIKE